MIYCFITTKKRGEKKMKVIAYIRVSTKTQVEKGYGLADQERVIKEYANNNEQIIEKIFYEKGKSGKSEWIDDIKKRTTFLEMLSYAMISDIKTIIVVNTSRLWRNDVTKTAVKELLKKQNINLISIEQPDYSIYTTDPNQKMIGGVQEVIDEYTRDIIVKRLSGGRQTKANKGNKPCGRTPFGYKYDKEKNVVVDIQESIIVREMFDLRKTGLSYEKIANKLNDKGYTTRQKNMWNKSRVKEITDNKFYQGILVYNGQEIKGKHKVFI